ncbi:MAG: hypothetical protein HND58_17360 [Planctomycetota bacterium]|nr:MAG: hypothetical protein HND58_17360 [Planctomycetota bacterium]
MTRRIAKLTILYLLLGLVATWAVAFGCGAIADVEGAATVDGTRWARPEESGGAREIIVLARRDTRGTTHFSSWVLMDHHGNFIGPDRSEPTPEEISTGWASNVVMPAFLRSMQERSLDNPLGMVQIEASGWPFRAFWYEFRPVRSGQSIHGMSASGAIEIRDQSVERPVFRMKYPLVLPVRPLPFGFLANTIFYALLFVGLHQFVGWGRRVRRRRRGRCAACGYDLTGLDGACPECGSEPC